MFESALGLTVICLFTLSLLTLTPKTSLSFAMIAFFISGFFFFYKVQPVIGLVIIFLSLFSIVTIGLQSIMFFDVEKEFQRQYKKDITSVVTVVFSSTLFGILFVKLAMNESLQKFSFADVESYMHEFGSSEGAILILVGFAMTLMNASLVALIKKDYD